MPYLIQAEERELPHDLMHRLAEAIAERPDLILADGMHRLRTGHGILEVPDQAEADRLSQRFQALGLPVFVLDELLALPAPEPLDLAQPHLEGAVEVAAAAMIDVKHERVVGDVSPFRMRMTGSGGILADFDDSERTIEEHATRYRLDLLTRTKHWRARAGTLPPIESLLQTADLSGASLGLSVQNLLAGRRSLRAFLSEAEYDRHVAWLYQLRYARR
jgi:hypothetical protein